MPEKREENEFSEGSDNNFSDLGLPDAEEYKNKETIAQAIRRKVQRAPKSVMQCANLCQMNVFELEGIMQGRNLDGFTVKSLQAILDKLPKWW